MKRLHVHVGVPDLEKGIQFYNAMFGVEPVKVKPDYAKWLLDDPQVNFAISKRDAHGVEHLGFQVEEDNELEELRERMRTADMSLYDEGETVCCYSRSEKSWVLDPAGVPWEHYRNMEDAQYYGGAQASDDSATGAACCTPDLQDASSKSCC